MSMDIMECVCARLEMGLFSESKKIKLRQFSRARLDAKFHPKFHYTKKNFPVTLKCRHMHGVLNIDEIKN
jgi:hypothetical protein